MSTVKDIIHSGVENALLTPLVSCIAKGISDMRLKKDGKAFVLTQKIIWEMLDVQKPTRSGSRVPRSRTGETPKTGAGIGQTCLYVYIRKRV